MMRDAQNPTRSQENDGKDKSHPRDGSGNDRVYFIMNTPRMVVSAKKNSIEWMVFLAWLPQL